MGLVLHVPWAACYIALGACRSARRGINYLDNGWYSIGYRPELINHRLVIETVCSRTGTMPQA